MSKRLCISLLDAPLRSQRQRLPQCSLQSISITARNDHRKPHPHHRQQCRPFTLTPRRRAGQMSASRQVKMKQPSQPSMAVAMKKQQKDAMRDGSMLEMYGILPGTIVPPTGKNLPSWLKDPRGRLALEWHILKRRIQFGLATIWLMRWCVKPAVSLEKGKVPKIAKELYEDMYKHFAHGDLSPVEHKLSAGLTGSLRARISQRAANTSFKWTLEKYLSQPKLVWFQGLLLDTKRPKDDQMGIMQAVVRIRSRQRLEKIQRVMGRDRRVREILVDSEGKEIHEDEMERERRRSTKDATEYLVLQRFIKNSRTGPWVIWGTTEETSLARIQKVERQLQQAQRNLST